MEKTRVVITGATSGLGQETARQLAQRGWRIALTGRREDKLKEVELIVRSLGGEPLVLSGSVTDLDVVKKHYATIKEKWGGLDWAVLNAGVGASVSAKEFSADNVRWTFDTNVFGVANWMEAVLPDMVRAGSGMIAAVSSLAAFRGLPRSGAYSGSKAALNALLESARVDLRGTGVEIVTICPGFVKTELTARHGEDGMMFLLETEDGVRRMIHGIDARRRIVHFPWQLSYPMKYLVSRLPGWLYDRIATTFYKR